MPRGFILQAGYRITSGRPVVRVQGKLEDGRSFLIRDDRMRPRFYVRRADADRARGLGARTLEPERERTTLTGEPVVIVEVPTPGDVPPLRARLRAEDIAIFEADVRFAYRYLIDRGIRGSLEISGTARRTDGIGAVFDNPEVRPVRWPAELAVLSIDIETDPSARRLFSIALAGCDSEEVLLLTEPGMDCPAGAVPFATERELLLGFARRVRELDPDALTGWNVIDFDLAVLAGMARRLGIALELGRGAGKLEIRAGSSSGRGFTQATVPGRVVLDGIQCLRGAFVKVQSYSLQSVSQEILGRGKLLTGPDRAGDIVRAFQHDRKLLVDYNLEDARLVLAILDRLDLIPLTVERSLLTGMPPDRVAASVAAFDLLYLTELGRRDRVAGTVEPGASSEVPTHGGHVLDPRPGLHENVLVLDFRSLYPSVIRTFQIDPLGRVPHPTPTDDVIVAPNGAAFRREPGILPGLLDELFPRREAAKRAGDAVASQAIKILMNSFYGVLGTQACRFADPDLANAITSFGKEILLWSKQRIEARGLEVLYGDTDSLFVRAGASTPEAARALGDRLAGEINDELARHVQERFRVDSRLELEFERLYLKLLLPALRGGTLGARKRYAGLVDRGDRTEVVFTGLEAVRRDWTELSKRVQRELYERLFHERPIEEYLRGVVTELRDGRLDELLVYRKALRKRLNSYTASTPPHVAAARKMTGKPGRVISYIMTTQGAEPAKERRSPIDHEHYVQKQVRAVAEPVLGILGLDFDRVVGDDRQGRFRF